MAKRGSYGFLLGTGDVVRVSRVIAVHISSAGVILIDVLLDHAGVPGGVETAWRSKHFLGAPVPGATLATLNLAQVVIAAEFVVAEIAGGLAPQQCDEDRWAHTVVCVSVQRRAGGCWRRPPFAAFLGVAVSYHFDVVPPKFLNDRVVSFRPGICAEQDIRLKDDPDFVNDQPYGDLA